MLNVAVQEKLNELLDAEGGISKRKVSKFSIIHFYYLNLMFFVSSNGDVILSVVRLLVIKCASF